MHRTTFYFEIAVTLERYMRIKNKKVATGDSNHTGCRNFIKFHIEFTLVFTLEIELQEKKTGEIKDDLFAFHAV